MKPNGPQTPPLNPDRSRAAWLQDCLTVIEIQDNALRDYDFVRFLKRLEIEHESLTVIEQKATKVLSKTDWQS